MLQSAAYYCVISTFLLCYQHLFTFFLFLTSLVTVCHVCVAAVVIRVGYSVISSGLTQIGH